MNKGREYFSHDLGAHTDPEQIKMRREMGFEAVGIYWTILERLCAIGGTMRLSDLGEFAYEFRLDNDEGMGKLRRVICDFGLFDVDEAADAFSSPVISEHLKRREEVSEKRRKAIRTRWGTPKQEEEPSTEQCDEIQDEYTCNSSEIQTDTKESKVKEIKEKENKGKESKEESKGKETEGGTEEDQKEREPYPTDGTVYDKMRWFKSLHPSVFMSTTRMEFAARVDFQCLHERIEHSRFLQEFKTIDNLLDHYDDIIAGKYEDFK